MLPDTNLTREMPPAELSLTLPMIIIVGTLALLTSCSTLLLREFFVLTMVAAARDGCIR